MSQLECERRKNTRDMRTLIHLNHVDNHIDIRIHIHIHSRFHIDIDIDIHVGFMYEC